MSAAVRLYYKNVLASAIGREHGIEEDELARWAKPAGRIVEELNEQAKTGKLGYRRLPYDTAMHDRAARLGRELRGGCKNFVVLGIGGSALGNIALQTALGDPYANLLDESGRGGPRVFVMDNVDPVQFASLLRLIEPQLSATVFNVISKSGETAETAAQFLVVRRLIREKLGEAALAKHLVITTDPKSGTLRKMADEGGYRTLDVPAGVGGRFSVFSQVGLLSAAVGGIDTAGLLAGARAMDERVSEPDLMKNPAALYAVIQYLLYQRGKRLSVMFPYSYQLKDLADWFRQLWAESLGKAKGLDGSTVHVGPTPIKALGTTDQHSQVQLYREGPNDKVFTFLRVERFAESYPIPPELSEVDAYRYLGRKSLAELINAEQTGTEYALVASQRPCLTLRFPEISAHTVGQFIYLLETATSVAGALFKINTYDQPAVELGKHATFALMGRGGEEKLARELQPFAQPDERFLV